MDEIILAVDLGGTNIRMAAVDHNGGVLHLVRTATPDSLTGQMLADLLTDLAAGLRPKLTKTPAAIGIGVPANVTASGVLQHLPNIPALEGADLRSLLGQKLGIPVVLENDATAAAIGEHWLGAAKGVENWIMITLGTGIGGGVYVDGVPLRGPDGGAGKLGHICVEPDGHPCGCGSHGCIEQYASATAMLRLAREAGLDVANSHELYERWQAGDAAAKAVFDGVGRWLGITLGGLVNTFNPELIVIGGGASAASDALVPQIEGEIKARAFAEPAERARVVRTALGDDAGILGAARSAFDKCPA